MKTFSGSNWGIASSLLYIYISNPPSPLWCKLEQNKWVCATKKHTTRLGLGSFGEANIIYFDQGISTYYLEKSSCHMNEDMSPDGNYICLQFGQKTWFISKSTCLGPSRCCKCPSCEICLSSQFLQVHHSFLTWLIIYSVSLLELWCLRINS